MKKLLTALLVSAALTTAASACPMCKDSVSNREGEATGLHDSYTTGGQNISGGMNTSVYVMLGTFFGVLGMVSTVIVKGVRSSSDTTRGFPVDREADLQRREV